MNNFAVSSDGLATALQDSASSLKAGGNSLEQSVALVAAANKVLQDPNSVGSALRTISLRIRGTSTKELEALGEETDGVIQSTSKLQAKVKGLTGGVDILTDSGAYKDTYTIIKEIATVWEDMSDIDQAALLELLAGKNRSNAMAAMLTNMEDLTAAYDTAMQADGSALRENEKYLDSIQGRIDIFQNAVQTFWMNFINSDAVKFIVDLGTTGVNFLDTWYGKLITIGGIIDHYGLQLIPKLFKKIKVKDLLKGLWDNSALQKIGKDAIFAFQKEVVNSKFKLNFKDVIDAKSLKGTIDGLNINDEIKSKLGETLFSNGEDGGLNLSDSITSIDKLKKALSDAGIKGEEATLILADANEQLSQKILDVVMAGMGEKSILELTSAEKLKNAIATQTGNAELAESIVLTEVNAAGEAELTVAQKANTVEKLKNVLAEQGLNAEKIEAIMLDAGLITANAGVTASIKGIGAAIKKLLVEIGPIGWIVLAIGLIVTTVVALRKTTDDYAETLDAAKQRLQDTQSALAAVNDELKTTQDRMAELMAMDSLSFTEKEELDHLQKQNDELQRQIDLLELRKAQEQEEAGNAFVDYMESSMSDVTDYDHSGEKPSFWKKWLDAMGGGMDSFANTEENMPTQIERYAEYQKIISDLEAQIIAGKKKGIDISGLEDELEDAKEEAEEISEYVNQQLADWDESAEGLDYGISDEIDAWLDYINNTKDKWAIVSGGNNALTNTFTRIFNKDEFANIKKEIDGLVGELANGGDLDSINQKIQNIINSDEQLSQALKDAGLNAEQAAHYFTDFSNGSGYTNIEDAINNTESALLKLQQLLNMSFGDDNDLTNLFNENGKVVQDKLSEIFQGASETTRANITRILESNYEDIADGTADINSLLEKFSLECQKEILDMSHNMVESMNAEMFPGLKDEIEGIIDTIGELAAAAGEAADAFALLKQARKEEANSGSISLETLSKLIEYTDDYSQLISVDETGAIHLAANAQKMLIQTKIDAIRTNAQQAYSEAAATYQMAVQAAEAGEAGSALYNGYLTVVDEVAGALAYVGSVASSVWNAIKGNGWSGWSNVFKNASSAKTQAKSAAASGRSGSGGVSVSSAKAALDKAEQNLKIANGLTVENLEKRYSSDEASGSGSGSDSDSLLDWLEHYYEDIENKIEELNAELENVIDNTGGIDAKNTILDKIIGLYDQKMQKLANAEATYSKRAETLFNSFDSNIQQRILNGSLDIQTISDSDLASDIDKYYEYAQAASDARVQMEELANTIADTAKQKFDSVSDAYNNELELNQSVLDSLEKQVDLLEERGEQVGTNLYSAMIDQYTVREQLLKQQRQDLQDMLDAEVKMGHIKVGSEQWFEMVGTINELDDEIVDLSMSVEECQNAINDIKWDNFDKLISRFEELNKQLDFLFDRFTDNDGAFDEDGNWTNQGIAALGVLAEKMELAQKRAAEYSKALEELDKDYRAGLYSEDEYFEKQSELIEAQRAEVENYEDIKDSIIDLNEARVDAIKDAMAKELDVYKKLVDKTKELLNAEKDLYNFQKNVNAKKKNIALLEKQIAALTGSNSAEDITRRIKLQAELDEARSELDDEYYEHSIDMTAESLDKEVEYREKQNDKIAREYDEWLKDREAVIRESFNLVQNNADAVLKEIRRISEEYGIPIANEITAPWEAGSRAIADYKDQFINPDMVGAIDSFKSMLDSISSKWEESAVAAEEAAKRAAQAVAQQEKDVIAAQNRMVDNAKKAAQEVGSMDNIFSTSSSSGEDYTGDGYIYREPPAEQERQAAGLSAQDRELTHSATTKYKVVDGETYIPFKTDRGATFYYNTKDGVFVRGGSQGGIYKYKKGTKYYKFAKGTLGIPESAVSLIDELGEELVLNAGPNGRLQYLTKGTSVIPADITKKLMDIALDPTEVLERNRPKANANLSVASNIELNLNIAEVVHIDHADSDIIPDISKAVKTQMDKYMTSINNNLKKYTR